MGPDTRRTGAGPLRDVLREFRSALSGNIVFGYFDVDHTSDREHFNGKANAAKDFATLGLNDYNYKVLNGRVVLVDINGLSICQAWSGIPYM